MENLRNKVFSGFAWKFFERFLAQGITFVVSLVVARILSPDDYGVVAIVYVFTNIASVVVANGFNAALIQGPDVDESDFSTLFYCSFGISIILYGVLYFCAPFISKFYNMQELTPVIRILSLILPISSYNSIQNAFVSRMMDFKKNFWASFASSVISGGVGIVLALKGFGVWALVVQALANTFVNCVVQAFIVKWHPKFLFSLSKAIPLFRFGANSLGADLIGTVFNQLNSFVMGKWYSPTQLAYYNKGYSFPQLVNGNVLTVVSSVMFPAFSTASNDVEHLRTMAKKTSRMMAFVLCPMYFGMMAVSRNLITVLLTDKWLDSVPFLNIICVAYILGTISPMDIQLLKAVGRSDTVFHLEFIKKPIWLAMIVAALFINVYAVAFVLPLASIVEMFVNGFAVKKHIHYGISEKIVDWGKTIVPGALMFVLVYLMNFLPLNCVLLLILQIVVGVAFYVGFSVLTKNECLVEFLGFVKNKGQKND